jgi:CRISP-associated protein Cas1
MTDRVIEISERPARLKARGELLVIHLDGEEEITVPFAELSAVIATHPQMTISQAALAGLSRNAVLFVACDGEFMPVGMFLPTEGHFTQADRFEAQTSASLPKRKRLWQSVVRAKIKAQAALLNRLHGDDIGLSRLIDKVQSGDPENVEAQASQRYWRFLFKDKSFRRDPAAQDQNRMLNYGYAVLRAATARAVCGAGLHPSFGLHHQNKYDNFRLASDLMEPFRPMVDEIAFRLVEKNGKVALMTSQVKAELVAVLSCRVVMDGEKRTVTDALSRLAVSLVNVFERKVETLALPES